MEQIIQKPIDTEQVQQAWRILQRYRTGKLNLEKRVIENQQWYKLRHWQCMRKTPSQVEPVSGWLFNAIAGKHADAMDNYPAVNVLPREASDKDQAQTLSAILPVILEQCDFEEVYHRVWDSKLIGGTGIYGVFWDKEKHQGLGDVAVTKVDILSLFWQSGITDIQQSKNVFYVALQDNESLFSMYPQLMDKPTLAGREMSKYIYDDTVDTTDKSLVVDWYYKKFRGGKQLLHYCKFVGDTVLYASENDPAYAQRPAGMLTASIPLFLIRCFGWRIPPVALAISMWASPPRNILTGATRRFWKICWSMPVPGTSSALTVR